MASQFSEQTPAIMVGPHARIL